MEVFNAGNRCGDCSISLCLLSRFFVFVSTLSSFSSSSSFRNYYYNIGMLDAGDDFSSIVNGHRLGPHCFTNLRLLRFCDFFDFCVSCRAQCLRSHH